MCAWCTYICCMYLWSSILDPDACMYDAYIYDPWSWCMYAWCIYLWSLIRMLLCMMNMFDACIYDHRYLTLMHVCVMHVKNGDERTNGRPDSWILGVGWALPVKLRPPPPRLNRQGGPFSGRQKRHFSAYYRIKLKSILIIKMIISVMKIVIFLMIMVMKMTKNRQIPCLLSQNIPLLGTIT